jgi:hypothetical protein
MIGLFLAVAITAVELARIKYGLYVLYTSNTGDQSDPLTIVEVAYASNPRLTEWIYHRQGQQVRILADDLTSGPCFSCPVCQKKQQSQGAGPLLLWTQR